MKSYIDDNGYKIEIDNYGDHFVVGVVNHRTKQFDPITPKKLDYIYKDMNIRKYNLGGYEQGRNNANNNSSNYRRYEDTCLTATERNIRNSSFDYNSSKNNIQSTPEVIQEPSNRTYRSFGEKKFHDSIKIEPCKDISLFNLDSSYDVIYELTTLKSTRLVKDIKELELKWLFKLTTDKVSGIIPKTINEALDKLLTSQINRILIADKYIISEFGLIRISSFVSDISELSTMLGDNFEPIKILILEFLNLNPNPSYNINEEIKFYEKQLIYIVKDNSVLKELNAIDTIEWLEVPEESALAMKLSKTKISDCYVKFENKMFVYQNKKIRIFHVT